MNTLLDIPQYSALSYIEQYSEPLLVTTADTVKLGREYLAERFPGADNSIQAASSFMAVYNLKATTVRETIQLAAAMAAEEAAKTELYEEIKVVGILSMLAEMQDAKNNDDMSAKQELYDNLAYIIDFDEDIPPFRSTPPPIPARSSVDELPFGPVSPADQKLLLRVGPACVSRSFTPIVNPPDTEPVDGYTREMRDAFSKHLGSMSNFGCDDFY